MNINLRLPRMPKIDLTALRNNTLDGIMKVCDKAKAKPPTDGELTAIIESANLSNSQKLVVLKYLQSELDNA